jgi:hypothetical protein
MRARFSREVELRPSTPRDSSPCRIARGCEG